MRLAHLPWPQILLLVSAALSLAAGVLLVAGGEPIGYVVAAGSVALAGFVVTELLRRAGRRD